MPKVFIDSNLFVRHLTQDDPQLSSKASEFFEDLANKKFFGYVSSVVLHEVTYVLRKGYHLESKDISGALLQLLALENLEVIDMPKELAFSALVEYGTCSVDLADIFSKSWSLKEGLVVASFDHDMQKIGAPLYKF